MRRRFLVLTSLLVAAAPATASAQREAFFAAFVQFHQTIRGAYGDEGPRLSGTLETMTAALAAWDRDILLAEARFQPVLKGADTETALQVHTVLASLYLDRGRFDDALREFETDIRIDASRAAFHRYVGLLHQAAGRHAEAADAFRAAWLAGETEPQDAYRLVAYRSARTTTAEIERALALLAGIEGELVRRERGGMPMLFRTIRPIEDDAGGLAFVPPSYAPGFSLMQRGRYEDGLAALRTAVATDPLVTDPASGSAPMTDGIAALRQGALDTAVEHFEAAVARFVDSSEARRMLGIAYRVRGDVDKAVPHLRAAVKLRPRDERSWLALARTLEDLGEAADTDAVLRAAIAVLPDSGALRWRLRVARGQRIDASDLELLDVAERLVLFAGKGELLGQMAAMARGDLDDARARRFLEAQVVLTPNNAVAHRALGRAHVGQGRDEAGYAELVTALLLDPLDAETLTALGQLHLAAGRLTEAVAVLERALAVAPGNSEALHALGSGLVRAGRASEGQRHLEESVRRQAQDVEDQRSRRNAAMLVVQGEIHAARGDWDAAVDAWTTATAVRRDSVGHLQMADALVKAGRREEAVTVLSSAIPSRSRPETHRRLAAVYAGLGRAAESARELATYQQQRLTELRLGD